MVQSQATQSLTIGKLAAAGGVRVETIRYYQRRGLLGTPTRDRELRRYGSEDLRRLRFIRQAQSAGFTLEEIKELLGLDASEARPRAREREFAPTSFMRSACGAAPRPADNDSTASVEVRNKP